jgi:hypothetical protein
MATGGSLALLKRERRSAGGQPVNAKRISQIVRLRVHGLRSARHQVARKFARIGTNLADQIEHLEAKVADLNPAATGKPSPVTGMAMLRPWPGEERFSNAKNKRAKRMA